MGQRELQKEGMREMSERRYLRAVVGVLAVMLAGGTAGVVAESTATAGMGALGAGAEQSLYSEGTQAIHESRWADAVEIFSQVAGQKGDHAEAALYWEAYAESKLGQGAKALAMCAELRQGYPASRWIDECGALEIEIRSGTGQAVGEPGGKDADLKLLALNALMQQNEGRAVGELGKFLKGKESEAEKERALFVLSQGSSVAAHDLLQATAEGGGEPKLAAKAGELLAARAKAETPEQARLQRVVALDAIVTDRDGVPVQGLGQGDFTVLDNGQPVPLMSFRAAGDGGALSEVILVIDTVNTWVLRTGLERTQIEEFLRSNGGQLKYPVSVRVFSGDGVVELAPPSRDGNALADKVHAMDAKLKPVRRSEGFYGDVEILQMSLAGLGSVAAEAAHQPGHKLLIWVSPGWPLLIRTDTWETTDKETRGFFQAIVSMSMTLRRARITLDSIDGMATAGEDSMRWNRYMDYVKGVSDPRKAVAANLSLQTLATQSGGEVMNFTNEFLAGQLEHAIERAGSDYFLSFEPAAARKADEYHELKVTVGKPGLVVRARTGYYSQAPSPWAGPARALSAEQTEVGAVAGKAGGKRIGLDLVATDAAGNPVHGLTAADFKVMDGSDVRAVAGFRSEEDAPAKILFVIDTINESLLGYPYVRDQVEAYLRRDGGRLSHPVEVILFDGQNVTPLMAATEDGNALADALEKAGLGERGVRHSSGGAGVLPRAQLSLAGLGKLATAEAMKPGRKLLVWLSPGWPIYDIDSSWFWGESPRAVDAPLFHDRKPVFDAVVALSTGLRAARMLVYSIKPNNTPGAGSFGWDKYKSYLNGVKGEKSVLIGDLGLQVVAVKSGGDAVTSTSDYLSGVIAKTVAEAEADYFVAVDVPAAGKADEFHELKVTVDKPGVTVRTRAGYYGQP